MISFQPLNTEDYTLLLAWLAKPHVKQWWDDGDDTLEKVAEHYGEEAGEERFVIWYQESSSESSAPIGYIQSYREGDGAMGIDLFLGEERFVNRGIGTQVLQSFIQQAIERHDPPYFVIDPALENARAIRCYEKVGFRRYATVLNEEGKPAYMMRLDRNAERIGGTTD